MNKVLLLSSSIFLSACGQGGIEIAEEPIGIVPVTPSALEVSISSLKDVMSATSPSGSYEGYILPESDDFFNIPQDPSNQITAEKVALGKLLYHETGMTSTETNKTDMVNTWSCASCHNGQNGFKF